MPLSELTKEQLEAMVAYLENKRAGPWERAARISIVLVGVLVAMMVILIARYGKLERQVEGLKGVAIEHQKALEELAK